MTFLPTAWAVSENQITTQLMRLMNQAATIGSNGVVGHLDCQVQATAPATSGIIVTPGGVAVLGQEFPYQGTYTGWNPGNDTTLSIAATGGSPRSDMVVARAEDPTWSGTPWGGNPAGQIIYPRVISGVSSGAVELSNGQSLACLARIDMPASQTAVQGSYIHDVRQVANPQRIMQQVYVAGPGSAVNWKVQTTPNAWPPGASWTVPVPVWATSMVYSWTVTNILYLGGGTNWARGYLQPVFGASVGSPVLTCPQTLLSYPSTSPYRVQQSGAGQVSIGPTLRGTSQTLQFSQVTDGTQTGVLAVDEASVTFVLYEFQQLAATT